MERFVTLIVAGGLVLLAGLWAVVLLDVASPEGVLGAAAVALGTLALGAGIRTEIEV